MRKCERIHRSKASAWKCADKEYRKDVDQKKRVNGCGDSVRGFIDILIPR
jgi:hypothetical protein